MRIFFALEWQLLPIYRRVSEAGEKENVVTALPASCLAFGCFCLLTRTAGSRGCAGQEPPFSTAVLFHRSCGGGGHTLRRLAQLCGSGSCFIVSGPPGNEKGFRCGGAGGAVLSPPGPGPRGGSSQLPRLNNQTTDPLPPGCQSFGGRIRIRGYFFR